MAERAWVEVWGERYRQLSRSAVKEECDRYGPVLSTWRVDIHFVCVAFQTARVAETAQWYLHGAWIGGQRVRASLRDPSEESRARPPHSDTRQSDRGGSSEIYHKTRWERSQRDWDAPQEPSRSGPSAGRRDWQTPPTHLGQRDVSTPPRDWEAPQWHHSPPQLHPARSVHVLPAPDSPVLTGSNLTRPQQKPRVELPSSPPSKTTGQSPKPHSTEQGKGWAPGETAALTRSPWDSPSSGPSRRSSQSEDPTHRPPPSLQAQPTQASQSQKRKPEASSAPTKSMDKTKDADKAKAKDRVKKKVAVAGSGSRMLTEEAADTAAPALHLVKEEPVSDEDDAQLFPAAKGRRAKTREEQGSQSQAPTDGQLDARRPEEVAQDTELLTLLQGSPWRRSEGSVEAWVGGALEEVTVHLPHVAATFRRRLLDVIIPAVLRFHPAFPVPNNFARKLQARMGTGTPLVAVDSSSESSDSEAEGPAAKKAKGRKGPDDRPRPFPCDFPHCAARFLTYPHLRTHQKRSHSVPAVLRCPVSDVECGFSCNFWTRLKAHVRDEHFKDLDPNARACLERR